MIKNEQAIRETLTRINNSYGRGKITKYVFNGYADRDKSIAVHGMAIVQLQFGTEAKRFDIYTHGNGKMGIRFRGKYRVCKTDQEYFKLAA